MKNKDHDRLFKELLTHHFEAFIEGFYPEIHNELDFSNFDSTSFLSQEQVPELGGKLHRLDIIAKVKIKKEPEKDAFVVIFVEAQQTRDKEFLGRVFRYFALLHLKHNLTIIPMVIYSDKKKWRNEKIWTEYNLGFAGHEFLKFKFLAIKPAMLSIKDYLRSNNPAQIALASLMDLSDSDLMQSKVSLIRNLAKLKITPADMYHVFKFVDTYLEDDDENLEKELDLLKEENSKGVSMLVDYIKNQGIIEGREQLFSSAGNLAKKNISWEVIQECIGIAKPEYENWLSKK